MKGQAFNKTNDTEIIRLIADNPGIICSTISKKLEIPVSTIQTKIKRLSEEKRVFKQTKKNGNGNVFPLFTTHYARENRVPRLYVDKDEKSTLELQMMWSGLIRGLAR